jgi:hypothetical protein
MGGAAEGFSESRPVVFTDGGAPRLLTEVAASRTGACRGPDRASERGLGSHARFPGVSLPVWATGENIHS